MKKKEIPEMTAAFLERVAHRFKVLGEPARLRLVYRLMEGEKTVGTLVDETGLNQANASRHLQSLVQAGLLQRRKEGNFVYYGIQDSTVYDLCDLVCGSLKAQHEKELGIFSQRGGES
ncbi:MAG: metalloregulator ArsR/SmtB family transcription factor [Opitutales bacterium]